DRVASEGEGRRRRKAAQLVGVDSAEPCRGERSLCGECESHRPRAPGGRGWNRILGTELCGWAVGRNSGESEPKSGRSFGSAGGPGTRGRDTHALAFPAGSPDRCLRKYHKAPDRLVRCVKKEPGLMVPYEDFPSPETQTARSHRRLRQPRRRPMKTMAMPRTAATAPPISIHIERSVGEPVKARDTSDVNECDSLKPNTSRSKPA